MALSALHVVCRNVTYPIEYAPNQNRISYLSELVEPLNTIKIPVLCQELDKSPFFVPAGIVTLEGGQLGIFKNGELQFELLKTESSPFHIIYLCSKGKKIIFLPFFSKFCRNL